MTMPVSKKPRRQKTATSEKKEPVTPQSLPDRRVMEGFLANFSRGRANDATARAQDMMYDAFGKQQPRARVALAKKALEVSPLCADAWVLLAEEAAQSAEEALDFYRKGVEAGELALGPAGFKKYAGSFWGFLETRPYMRARAGLASALRGIGQHEAAIDHYRALLELNPNDNQGIRYVLAASFLERGDVPALKALLSQYDEDCTAQWRYTQALVAFREGNPAADKIAEQAWCANNHVPALLSGTRKALPPVGDYITIGGEDEAAHYAEENGAAWQSAPGAVEWLTKVTANLVSKRPTRTLY
jgi:tetratricopeptide (TPR) repeat protein